jgi:aromatic-L-amino-acid decarboxylase
VNEKKHDPPLLDPEEFRRQAHRLADWMADYLRDVKDLPVVPKTVPGSIRDAMPAEPPETGESFDALFDDFRTLVVPGMTHWNHPGWFGYFPANTSPPSILAEMLTAVLGAQCMSWQTSPAATELEQVVMGWLRQMLGLPEGFSGVIQDTASTATLVALLTARERATGYTFNTDGAAAPGAQRLTVYASTEAHSSVEKAVKLAGLGLARYRRIAVDENFALDPAALETIMARDVDEGLIPCAVVGVTGTTSSTAIDPLRRIGELCQRFGAWFHVDAAYAGSAAILPERRAILDGIELADSFVFNPHKWLFTNFDCSAYFVRDREALLRTFSMTPEYLKTAHDQEVVNFRDWGIQMGRRFRALKLWFVIRSFGVEGLREKLRGHIALAESFARRVEEHPHFELLAPAPFGLVCFRCRPPGMAGDDPHLDQLNRELLEKVNADGRVHLTHTSLGGRYTIRLSVGQLNTTATEVDLAWKLFSEAAG